MSNIALCLFHVEGRRCLKPAASRGLCRNHYAAVWYKVKSGKTTWRALASEGRALLLAREEGSFLERVSQAAPQDFGWAKTSVLSFACVPEARDWLEAERVRKGVNMSELLRSLVEDAMRAKS